MPDPRPTGLPLVDALASLQRPTLADFVSAASEYIVASPDLGDLALEGGVVVRPAERKKAGQIRLSNALGRALALDLRDSYGGIDAEAGETYVSGALRVSKVDVVEVTKLDGLKLAIELKPINLAVGRAIWNRFGDIRVSAVSTHLKYPFAVAGGVLTIPTVEFLRGEWRSTEHLIVRLIELLRRAGGRQREDDAPHRLEGVAVVAFDPHAGTVRQDLPAVGSGLRWEEAVAALAHAYEERFAPASTQLEAAGGE
ncbi:MAG: hypothetical protein M3R39_08225 [Actinomycetota bacterium]|nr:hypothetical protein [Actinomycetota bacterium]